MHYWRIIGIDRKTKERAEVIVKDPEADIMVIWRRFAKITRIKVTSIERLESDVRP